jgi:hypothetical protein
MFFFFLPKSEYINRRTPTAECVFSLCVNIFLNSQATFGEAVDSVRQFRIGAIIIDISPKYC